MNGGTAARSTPVIDFTRQALRRVRRAAAGRLARAITHVSTTEPVAALTFDDGPDPVHTSRLLDLLEKYRVRATFFMIGQAALKHPDIVRRVADGGHSIGNHTWSHRSFPSISTHERCAEIRACERALAPYSLRLFRPPYGDQSVGSWLDATRLRYAVVTWNATGHDWHGRDAAWIVEQVMSRFRPGSIIGLHDGLFDASSEDCLDRGPTLSAVEILLARLGGAFRFVTVPELLRHGRPVRAAWLQDGTSGRRDGPE